MVKKVFWLTSWFTSIYLCSSVVKCFFQVYLLFSIYPILSAAQLLFLETRESNATQNGKNIYREGAKNTKDIKTKRILF